MNSGQSLFSQLIDHLPRHEFRRCVERYAGNYRVRSFSCWDHFLTMMFAQLSYRESLRDIVACLRSQQRKLYRLGIRGKVSRSTLADANESRDRFHINQPLIARHFGGGPDGRQARLFYLPEPQTDFILAVISEEQDVIGRY